jgi:hypothetical protein
MKRITINRFLLGFVFLLAATACQDALTERPRTFLSQETVFSSRDGAVSATVGIYEPFREDDLYGWWLLGNLEFWSDYIFGRGSQAPPSLYQLNATGITRIGFIWRGAYNVINRANIVVQQLEEKEIEGLDNTLKEQLIGEARFLRALSYFHLVRLFGAVPLRTVPETDQSKLAIPRSPVEDVYAQILSDLQFAEDNLPDVNYNEGRATRWSASGLLSIVYLTRSQWSEAAAKAKEIMDSGLFQLVEVEKPEDFQNIFGPTVVTHSEEIFSLKHARIEGLEFEPLWLMHRAGSGYSLNGNAHAWFGNPDSWLGDWMKEIGGPDMRTTDWMYNGPHDEQFLSPEIPMLFKKFRDPDSDLPGNDFPIVRYSEILLIFAEATSQANGGPTPEAYEAANKIRRRARGLDLNTPAPDVDFPPGLNAADFQDEILLERAKEFVMEGKRWYDLLRTGKTLEVIRASGVQKSAIQEKHLKWPIPAVEIDNNEGMTQADQNPGW